MCILNTDINTKLKYQKNYLNVMYVEPTKIQFGLVVKALVRKWETVSFRPALSKKLVG